jgi:hypothetical protein
MYSVRGSSSNNIMLLLLLPCTLYIPACSPTSTGSHVC